METMEQGKPTLTSRRRGSAGLSVLRLNSIGEIHATMQITVAPRFTIMIAAEIVFASSEMCQGQGIKRH